MKKSKPALPEDPLWYKDAVFYELRVRSFYDSNGDGIGDFPGLTEKLDYLESLGVTTLWLLPFYPSPMRDDGYDIADYTDVHPDLGTLQDFKLFLREAHRRGLRVVTELVLNHTSDQHPWFQQARRAPPGGRARDFYVWSDDAERYSEARVIFQDFEHSNWTWDPLAKAYYWHRFYSHQPDLNFDNPAVRRATTGAVDFWLELGVDGLRLDAVPYLYQREGTSCENLPETHAFLKQLRRHVDRKYPNRMLLAEANQWPEDASAYIGPDECHMAFHFPIMPRMFMSVHMEDRFPLTDIVSQTPTLHPASQWALFLRNHDELTLEMVTDEERDYMYRAYARDQRMRINLGIRRRLAPLIENDRRTIELLNGLLLSLPGTPVLYYGDEIGMGDNVYLGDRDGVRTPMQWSPDRNAGFSDGNPQRLVLPVIIDPEYNYETINVEAQEQNRHSLLWWTRRLIAMRKQFKAFGRGEIEFLNPENPKVLVFTRAYQDEKLLVVANLSRFAQFVELDLSPFKGLVPRELFGNTFFPRIAETPYLMTLGPHGFYWFALETARGEQTGAGVDEPRVPALVARTSFESFLKRNERESLEAVLPAFFKQRRWFGGKARALRSARIVEILPMTDARSATFVCLIHVDYAEGDPDNYLLPLTFGAGDRAREIETNRPDAVIARLALSQGRGGEGIIYDSFADEGFCSALLGMIERRRRIKGVHGELAAVPSAALASLRGGPDAAVEPRLGRAEQSNTSVIFGAHMIMKAFRRIDEGVSPDLEIGHFLTQRGFTHTSQIAGHIEYRLGRREPMTLAVLQGFVPNEGDAWMYTLEELRRFFERALTIRDTELPQGWPPLMTLAQATPPQKIAEAIGPYMESARLLGRRTAELHLALTASAEDRAFATETYTTLYQRSIYQSMRSLVGQNFRLLRRSLSSLPEPAREQARALLARQDEIVRRFEVFLKRRVTVVRSRCHGDFHLGQVLFTGKDFVIIDFEGEPARSLSERRRKRSALRDVAGMLRSFHYAALGALREERESGRLGERERAVIEPWAVAWQTWSGVAYLKEYLETAGKAPFVPRESDELRVLLDAFLLEKAVYELGYELNNRPDWLEIPIGGIESVLGWEGGHGS
jgi:maltose alpha-D-glucosyltransferase/alpha-amylase